MLRFTIPLAAAALALAACSARDDADMLTVSDVRVDADVSAVQSRTAAAYWGTLSTDLASAIAAEFVGQTSPTGYLVDVDVDELSLANALNPRLGADDARLTGAVSLIDPRTDKTVRFYTVSATSNQAARFLPQENGMVRVSPSSHEFYEAVVQAFARGVADAVRTGVVAEAAETG